MDDTLHAAELAETLPGEGDRKIVERTRVRIDCDQCGEVATKKHTYLLPDARRNPASSAYGRDDCSWCSDHEEFTCDDCPRPRPEGYGWCSTFSVTARFAHMFLRWIEREIPASVDTRPKDEDPAETGASLASGAVGAESDETSNLSSQGA